MKAPELPEPMKWKEEEYDPAPDDYWIAFIFLVFVVFILGILLSIPINNGC